MTGPEHPSDHPAEPSPPLPILPAQAVTSASPAPRYVVEETIGEGGCGRVYSVHDRDLGRVVAVKVALPTGESAADASDGMTDLLTEARVTAGLDHPGVVPIYDIGRTAAGAPYFTMRRISGHSLVPLCGERDADAEFDGPPPTVNDRLTILLKLCDVLAAAHHQGVLHCDIKPGNIMLGSFGEVLLVDWGIAASLAHGSATSESRGTPAYMSPEQARGEPLTVRSDVYALGATMFDLFTGRPPIHADGSPPFWERKRRGELDPPTAAERARVPRKLLAIAAKAMAAAPGARYHAIAGFADDLRRFQAGQSVSACRDSLDERVARWWRAHRRTVGIVAALLLVTVALGGYVYGERLKGIATWGRARWAPSLADGQWQRDWSVLRGGFRNDGDALVTTDDGAGMLVFNRRMDGPSAIEFTGRMLPEGKPCDLSVIWFPDKGAAGPPDLPALRNTSGWMLQAGAFDNLYCGISGPWGQGQVIRYRTLEPGRDYRIRAEVDERRLALYVDGELMGEYHAALPFASGRFALYGYYKGKRFSAVRIYNKGVPERLAPTAIGDAFADQGRWGEAAEQYARVAASLAGRPAADEARYRQGLCHLQVDDLAGAERVWQPLAEVPGLADRVRGQLLERRVRTSPKDQLAALRAFCRDARGEDRELAAQAWRSGATTLVDRADAPEVLLPWLAVRDEFLADQDSIQSDAAKLLINARRPRGVLERFPTQRWLCADAWLQLGEYERVRRDYGDLVIQRRIAIATMGDYAAALAETDGTPRQQAGIWLDFGRAAELLAHRDEVDPDAVRRALLQLDRPQEALAGAEGETRLLALLALGRLDEVIAGNNRYLAATALAFSGRAADAATRWRIDASLTARMRAVHLLERLQAGERLGPADLAAPYATIWDLGPEFATWQYLLVPFVRETQGEAGVFDAACRAVGDDLRPRFRQALWYDARYLAGEIDRAAYLEQPMRVRVERRLLMLDGIRAERAGKKAEALRCYQAWAGAFPYGNDPVGWGFVKWRGEK